ncbi:MAG: tetratricopeptide repeat protein [Rhodospirillaceae bacterium]|nr:tetratricopeptide repeat protein [Rhodospirillaceae bacterium]MBT4119093.1 tetratricopeptide repeat protein [Rhodospirillaceae bacterium]MBT4674807.1 tetratricopeptide repeat protein [Rhodospirillaceae bacterium]MBT5179788.1 tetratricopeptide repeat protein [Rhodospirillaceae bacterium]MBT6289784.1 tetratricopeptide repeat protein [Rhodospirillaceae bacterium]
MNHMHKGPVAQDPRRRFGTGAIRPARRKVTIDELIAIGNRYHKEGELRDAETIFRKVLEVIPNHPVALQFLGVIAHQTENFDAAISLINRAIESAPDYHQAYNNLGNAYEAKGEMEKALEVYQKALDLDPDYFDANFNMGIAQRHLRQFEDAAESFQRCIEFDPRCADAHYELGFARQRLGDRVKAQISYQVALNLDPDHADARVALGEIFTTVGRVEEAIEEYNVGLETQPDHLKLLAEKGVAQRKIGLLEESLATIEKAQELNPEAISTMLALGSAYQTIGDITKATESYMKAVEMMPHSEAPHKCLLFVLLNVPGLSAQELFDIHRQVRGPFDKPEFTAKSFPERNRDPDRRLRIGYVSSDFRTHVVAMNILPVMVHHDHEAFEVFLYGQVEYPDQITDEFKKISEHYRSTMQKSNDEVAAMIEEDEIDIVIYLAGRFDENRPIVATYRPAPIQVSYHDCATSGLEAMDYYLTDEILHPRDTPEKFTEALYRLPVYYQYPVQEGLPEIKPAPVIENGYVTFGCLNKPEKLNDQVIALWSRVLDAVPNSRLYLKYFNHYSQESMRKRWENKFADHGIGADRLIFNSGMDDRASHLELYSAMDIALDPFPFNGATTTFEAMTMGMPVITLLGSNFVDRVAASIATHAGFPEFIAKTKDDYVALAVEMASDPVKLNALRQGMRDALHQSDICDSEPYARSVEAAFRDMWRTWIETGGYKEI